MIEGIRLHGADEGDVIGDGAEVGQDGGHFSTGLTVFFKFEFGPEEVVVGGDEGGLVIFKKLGRGLGAVESGEGGFVVEEVKVTGGSSHEKVDDILGLGGRVGELGGEGIELALRFERGEGNGSESDAAFFHEPTTGVGALDFGDDVRGKHLRSGLWRT